MRSHHYVRATLAFMAGLWFFQMALSTSASADEHRVIVGMATTSANVTTWWHGENALDLTNRSGGTIDQAVYHQSRFYSGSGGWMRAVARNYSITSKCTGRYVELYDPGGNYLGKLNYVHIATNVPDGYTWTIPASGWNIVYLGTVLEDEPDEDCPHTGPHLHQGGVGTKVQNNTGLQSYVASQGQPNIIEPTGDYANRWMHKVTLVDSDGDGCSDQEELGGNPAFGGQRDPSDPWDFFDVPTGNPPVKTRVIDVDDAFYVLGKFGSVAGDPISEAPPYDPAFDRSAPPAVYPAPGYWRTQAPDGHVDLDDFFWNLNCFGHTCFPPP